MEVMNARFSLKDQSFDHFMSFSDNCLKSFSEIDHFIKRTEGESFKQKHRSET
jgi:hypothetical protein